jgi:hypothetical protein
MDLRNIQGLVMEEWMTTFIKILSLEMQVIQLSM